MCCGTMMNNNPECPKCGGVLVATNACDADQLTAKFTLNCTDCGDVGTITWQWKDGEIEFDEGGQ